MASDLLDGLSEAQAAVVTDPAMPLVVMAGPGAGKTRVLTRRIAWRSLSGDARPERTLALTFSRRAAEELQARLASLGLPPRAHGGVTAGTFHAVAWAQLSRHRADRGLPPLRLLTRPGPLAQPSLAGVLGHAPEPGAVRTFLAEVGWARQQGVGPGGYAGAAGAAGRWPPWPVEAVGAAWAAYDQAKQRGLVLDLDDLLGATAALIEHDAEAAAAARWRHRHVFVDEYQDLNAVHLRLLKAWTGGRRDICLAGDPDQAVYGFNGACDDLFARVGIDWPGAKVARLDEDFRSSPEVVAITESVRAGEDAPGRRGGAARRSRRAPGPLPRAVVFADEEQEAAVIAASARQAGGGWARMAVLARTNARLRVVAAALTAEGVPWRLRDPRPLSERPVVQQWLQRLPAVAAAAELAALLVSGDDVAATDLPDLDAVAAALEEYRAQARRPTVGGFHAWLDATGVVELEPAGVGVDLVTFHRAKGLEWSAVWVAGVDEGLVPLASSAGTAAGLAEERRLLYVALSRAANELTITSAGCPSKWLAPIASAAAALSACPPAPEQRRRLAMLRGGLGSASAQDGRRDALLSWRRVQARAARVAPEIVLPDAVVAAIASSTARTADEIVGAAPHGGRRVRAWAAELAAVLATKQPA